MATIRGYSGMALSSSNDFDFEVIKGRLYWFEVFYASGATLTVTVKQLSPDKSTYQNATLPSNPAADMVITASGVARGFDLRATGTTIRFSCGVLSGAANISFGEVQHGRS